MLPVTAAHAQEMIPLCPDHGLRTNDSSPGETFDLGKGAGVGAVTHFKPVPLSVLTKADTSVGGVFSTLVNSQHIAKMPELEQLEIAKKLAKASSQPLFEPWKLDLELQARSAHLANIAVSLSRTKPPLHPFALRALESPDLLRTDYGALLRLQSWAEQPKYVYEWEKTTGKPLVKRRRDQEMTAGGENTPPGNLDGIKPGQFVATGSADGAKCLRLARDVDFLPQEDGEINVVYDPLAFLEVGKIMHRDEAHLRRHLCTVILVSDAHALTAAHCALVPDSAAPRGYREREALRLPGRTRVLFPKPGHERELGLECMGGPVEKCNYHRATVIGVSTPQDQAWAPGAAVPSKDIAILHLQFEGTRPEVRVRLGKPPKEKSDITIVGFGTNDIAGQRVSGVQYAGWQRVGYVKGDGFGWIGNNFADAQRVTSACTGDSGGPVYNGVVNKAPSGADLRVSAVLSFIIPAQGSGTGTSAKVCDKATVKALSLAPYREFICALVGANSTFCS